jgi:hypothetical protein
LINTIADSLWIATSIIGFLAYAGLGITALLACKRWRGHAVLIAPWVGYAVTVTVSHWCAWLGWSVGQAIIVVLIIATPCNLLGLLQHHRSIDLRAHLGIFGLTGMTLAIALYPIWHTGFVGPVGINGDSVLYTNVAAHLETAPFPSSQPAEWAAATARHPALLQLALVRDYGLPYGFSYLHAIADRLTQRESHETFSLLTAVALALAVPVYACLARGLFGAGTRAALLTAFLAAVSPTLMWLHYNGYAMHVMSLGLMPLAFGMGVLAWGCERRSLLLAALLLSAVFATYPPAALMFAIGPLAAYAVLRSIRDKHRWGMHLRALSSLLFLAALVNLPGLFQAGTFLWHLLDLRFATQFGDVENYAAWRSLYGLAHYRLSEAMAPPGRLSAWPLTSAAAAVVLTLVGLWRSAGAGRLALGALGLVYIPLLIWLRYGLDYPYGHMKALTFATFPTLIALSLGWEYLAQRPKTLAGRGAMTFGLMTVMLLAAINLVHLTVLARWITRVNIDFPALLDLRQVKDVIPPGTRIHLRDAKDTPLLWMTYFLKDYPLSIAHYTPYYLRRDWPFYRQAIDAEWVLADVDATPTAPWAIETVYANGRYHLLRKDPQLLFHLDILHETRALRPGDTTVIQGHTDGLVVDGQAFDLPHRLQAGQLLRLGMWVPAGSRLRCDGMGQEQVIQPTDDVAVLEWPLPGSGWQISLKNEGPRTLWLPGWVEVVRQGGQASQNAAVLDIIAWHREEVLPNSGVFRVSGWYPLEEGRRRWMTGTSVSILKNPAKPVALVLEGVIPDRQSTSSSPTVAITLNDQALGTLTGVGPFRATYPVSEEVLGQSRWAVLEMQGDAVSDPPQVDVSKAARRLGVMLTHIELLDLGLAGDGVIDFGTEKARRYLGEGWSIDERADGITYVWADAPESLVWVAIAHPTDMEVALRVLPMPLPVSATQELRMSINGVDRQHLTLAPGEWQVLAFTVPREALRPGLNRLRFAYRQTVSPMAVMPENRDHRTLAVAFDYIRFKQLPMGWEQE